MRLCVTEMQLQGAAAWPRSCPSCGIGPCSKYGIQTQRMVARAISERRSPDYYLQQTKQPPAKSHVFPDPAGFPILLTRWDIRDRIAILAGEINLFYKGVRQVTVVPVLDGAMVFAADLIRQFDFPVRLRPIRAKSYRRDQSSTLALDQFQVDIDEVYLILEDILDTGQTFRGLRQEFMTAKDYREVVLLDKGRSGLMEPPQFRGFGIPAEAFVVGYGLDYDNFYRELPDIRVFKSGV